MNDPWKVVFDQVKAEGERFVRRHLARMGDQELLMWGEEAARLAKTEKRYKPILKLARLEWKQRRSQGECLITYIPAIPPKRQ